MQWQDRVVIVTGASRGIGRAVAVAAAHKRARIGLIARTATDLESVRQQLDELGAPAAVAVADVADRDQVGAAVGRIENELGPTSILVANAGIGAFGPFVEADPDQVERLIRINLFGMMYALWAVLPGMIERGEGHVVAMGSIAGRVGAPLEAAYSASKFAQVGLAEALQFELAALGVKVSVVTPGVIDTDFFAARGHAYQRDFPRPIPPASVAAAVIRCVERDRAEQVVPRWMRQAVMFRHLAPGLYRWGTRRTYRDELGPKAGSTS